MDYLSNLYKNKAENLAKQIQILESKLAELTEDAPSMTFSGTGKGQKTFSDEELKDQMRQNKRTGAFGAEVPEEKQTQEYKDAKAELERRQGASAKPTASAPTGGESLKGVPTVELSAETPDWVERWSKKWGDDPRKIEAMRRGVIEKLGGDATKPIDTSLTAPQVGKAGQEAYEKAKAYVVGLQQQAAAKKTKQEKGFYPTITGAKPAAPGFDVEGPAAPSVSAPTPSLAPLPPEQVSGRKPIYPGSRETISSQLGEPKIPVSAPETPKAKPSIPQVDAFSQAQSDILTSVGKTVLGKGKEISDYLKKVTMTTQPMQGQPAGGADIDIQRGGMLNPELYPQAEEKPEEKAKTSKLDIGKFVSSPTLRNYLQNLTKYKSSPYSQIKTFK